MRVQKGKRAAMSNLENDHCASHDVHVHAVPAVKDLVCGMTVDPHTAKYRHGHNGRPYYFCSDGCHEKFSANPTASATRSSRRQSRAEGYDLHVPHASRDTEGGAWRLPDMRHGARATAQHFE